MAYINVETETITTVHTEEVTSVVLTLSKDEARGLRAIIGGLGHCAAREAAENSCYPEWAEHASSAIKNIAKAFRVVSL